MAMMSGDPVFGMTPVLMAACERHGRIGSRACHIEITEHVKSAGYQIHHQH